MMAGVDLDSLAKNVAPGRCLHCGHKKITWSPVAIVEAARVWEKTYGHAPRAREWAHGTPDHPSPTTVREAFGNWNGMLRAAGLETWEPQRRWTKQQVIETMQDDLFRTGRWPRFRDWHSTGGGVHPSAGTVKSLFGSWNAAKRHAGWVENPRAVADKRKMYRERAIERRRAARQAARKAA